MIPEKTNPVPMASAAGLGNVTGQVDNREFTAPTLELQQKFVARRTRLRPDMAKIVAELAFCMREAA